MSEKRAQKNKFRRFLLILFFSLLGLNLLIIVSGKSYLYKGIKETYLKGRKSPGIYDSLVFPYRTAEHSKTPEKWEKKSSLITLSKEDEKLLTDLQTTSFLIVQHGEIIHESYYENHTVKTHSNSFSMAKSVIGLLIGIAVDEGKISSLDAPIADYLPFSMVNYEDVTIRDLLGMSSGLDWTESSSNPFSDNAEAYYTSKLFKMMTKKKFTWKPGEKFEYSSGNSQLLGIILHEATGVHPTEYFEEKVWSKIGSEDDFFWSLDHKNGDEKTYCCGYATTRDYAKIGQLILNNGVWNHKEIITKSTLEELISPYNEYEQHYGLHFWLFNHPEHPAVYLRGIFGQYIFVIPSLEVVMVRTGHQRKEDYRLTEEQLNDIDFVEENGYKDYHPMDIFDYFTILENCLNQ